MAKAKKSVRVEVVALSLFIVSLVGYNVISSVSISTQSMGAQAGAPTNVDAGGNAQCDAAWKNHLQKAIQEKAPNPEQVADGRNKGTACGLKCPGKCDVGLTPPTPHVTVCRADGCTGQDEKMGTPDEAAKAAADKAKELADQAKGGDPSKAMEAAKGLMDALKPKPKEPTAGTPTTENGCPEGQEKVGTVCQHKSAAANFSEKSGITGLLDAFKSAFLGTPTSPLSGLSPEEQLAEMAKQINADPTISTESKPAVIDFAEAYIEKNGEAPSTAQINAVAARPLDEIPRTVSAIDEAAKDLNILVPSSNSLSGGSSSADSNIINKVLNWLTSWF